MNPQVPPLPLRKTRTRLRVDGTEPLRVPGAQQEPAPAQGQDLYVPTSEVDRIHPWQRHIPSRHQTS